MVKVLALFSLVLSSLFAQTHSVCITERPDTQRAKEAIELILSKEPNNTTCMLQLANICLKQGQIARGFDILVQAYAIDPENVQNSKIATVLPFALKVTELRLQAVSTNNKEIWNDLGNGYMDMGIYDEAIVMYRKSLKVDPMQLPVRLKLAFALQRNTQIYCAIDELQQIINVEPKHFYANYYMGKLLTYHVKSTEKARVSYGTAKEVLLEHKDDFTTEEYSFLLNDINKELDN